MTRMCIQPGRFEPDEYWLSIGITTAEQVRHEVLWRAAEENDRPAHTGECPGCSELFESFLRLHAIAAPPEGSTQIAVACCPDTETLAAYQGGEVEGFRAEAIRDHLKECPPCREDLAFLARSQEPRDRVLSLRGRTILMAVAAAALVAAIIPWHHTPPSEEVKIDFPVSSRWANLAQMPPVDRAELLKEAPEAHRSRLTQVLDSYEKGDYSTAEKYALIMTAAVEDSSAEYLLAMARYKQNKEIEGYKAMLVSERISPQTAKRCWATMQYALLVGDKKTIEREAAHVGDDNGHGQRCRDVLSKLT